MLVSALADRASRRGLPSPPGDRPLARGAGRGEDQARQPRVRDGQVLRCSPAQVQRRGLPPQGQGARARARSAGDRPLDPVLETIASLSERIRGYDRQLEALSRELYPETALLRQVGSVGPITALTFVLVLEDAARDSGGAARSAPTSGSPPTSATPGSPTRRRNASPRGARSCSGSSWSRAPTTCSGPSPKTPTSGATA